MARCNWLKSTGLKLALAGAVIATIATSAGKARGQAGSASGPGLPNPYQAVANWAQLPDGRKWGSASAIDVGPDGNVWVAERCGGNNCADSDVPPVVELDPSGKMLKTFGAGLFVLPHGFSVDHYGNVWVTDQQAKNGKGELVTKLSPDGKVLLTLGMAGIKGKGDYLFNGPTDVLVAPNDDIFVADGHDPAYDSSRVVKYSRDGTFIKAWGSKGSGPGEFMGTHGLALDSKGRLFVADRGNSRIQIFDQDGNFIAAWKQFGRPSGIFIDKNDVLYVADNESSDKPDAGDGPGQAYNPGFPRGIRIGSVTDGKVTEFIPGQPLSSGLAGPDGVAVDHDGNVYAAEVSPKDVQKYAKK